VRRRFDSRDSSRSKVSLHVISTQVTDVLSYAFKSGSNGNWPNKKLCTTKVSEEIAAVSQWGLISKQSQQLIVILIEAIPHEFGSICCKKKET